MACMTNQASDSFLKLLIVQFAGNNVITLYSLGILALVDLSTVTYTDKHGGIFGDCALSMFHFCARSEMFERLFAFVWCLSQCRYLSRYLWASKSGLLVICCNLRVVILISQIKVNISWDKIQTRGISYGAGRQREESTRAIKIQLVFFFSDSCAETHRERDREIKRKFSEVWILWKQEYIIVNLKRNPWRTLCISAT